MPMLEYYGVKCPPRPGVNEGWGVFVKALSLAGLGDNSEEATYRCEYAVSEVLFGYKVRNEPFPQIDKQLTPQVPLAFLYHHRRPFPAGADGRILPLIQNALYE